MAHAELVKRQGEVSELQKVGQGLVYYKVLDRSMNRLGYSMSAR